MGGFAKRVNAGIIAHTTTRPGMVAFLDRGSLSATSMPTGKVRLTGIDWPISAPEIERGP